jgi:arginyl-tRNA synthetase
MSPPLCYNSMEFMMSETTEKYIGSLLKQASDQVFKSLGKQYEDSLVFNIARPDPGFGDYASNLPLVLAKKFSKSPAQAGELIISQLKLLDINGVFGEIYLAGGFINFRLSQEFLFSELKKLLEQGDLYGCSLAGEGKTVVVEYFQNNVAKPPHVGHLRSAVVGDCLLRILKSQGYKAVSDTHIGDWGTQFGILLSAYKNYIAQGGKRENIEKDPINELNKLYVSMSAQIETQPELREKGKEEFAKLEKGDTENRELWQWFVRVSLDDFERFRKLLDILPFDHNLGESFYEDKMGAVLDDLKSKSLLVKSDGAEIVDLQDKKLGVGLLVKSDGATTYLLRDLATIKYRVSKLFISKTIYVVDNRQSHHFEQIFEIALRAGYIKSTEVAQHVDLGFMSLPEGPIATRKGTIISLQNLIDEANKRALDIIEEKNPKLPNKEAVAKEVALGAIKYFDLSHNRKTEIIFTWDKALSFEGNTGPYLQYTHARIHGILRKAPDHIEAAKGYSPDLNLILKPQELAVLRKLVKFPEILDMVSVDYFPNNLCVYLFDLSQSFNAFYQEVPVLQEEDAGVKLFRLQLITATAQVINNGLYLLGIEAPEEM